MEALKKEETVKKGWLSWKSCSFCISTYTAGFKILRSEAESGQYTYITDKVIASKSTFGASDTAVTVGVSYFYKLLEIRDLPILVWITTPVALITLWRLNIISFDTLFLTLSSKILSEKIIFYNYFRIIKNLQTKIGMLLLQQG